MRAVGAPFVVAKYMGQEMRSAAGLSGLCMRPLIEFTVEYQKEIVLLHGSLKLQGDLRDTADPVA
eukprot:1763797-Rhodomonas_salina.1